MTETTEEPKVTGTWATLLYGPSGAPGGPKLERRKEMMRGREVRLLRQGILDLAVREKYVTIPQVAEQFGLTYAAAQSHLGRLVSLRTMRREERDKSKLGTDAPEAVSRYFPL